MPVNAAVDDRVVINSASVPEGTNTCNAPLVGVSPKKRIPGAAGVKKDEEEDPLVAQLGDLRGSVKAFLAHATGNTTSGSSATEVASIVKTEVASQMAQIKSDLQEVK